MRYYLLLLTLAITSLNAQAGIITTTFSDIEATPGSTAVRLDDFLPNPGANLADFGPVPEDAFTSAGIGLIIDGNYVDATSSQVTSDILVRGTPVTWTFVDPSDTSIKATVRQLGFYYGSVQETVVANFFDLFGNLIDSHVLTPSIAGTPVGFDALTSSIHKVVFTQSGTDSWVLGSFTQDTSINDIVFTDGKNQTSVPEPSTALLFAFAAIGLVSVRRQTSK